MWDERYAAKEYIYGTTPNLFFREQLEKLEPGKLLLPAEGEGRQAVFAALSGWQVTAFDPSIKGKEKALRLAKLNNVNIEYLSVGYQDMDFNENSYDAIGLVYAHMPLLIRPKIHQKIANYLKPGGKLILEGFSKEQINYSSGGPNNIEMLFSIDELLSDFNSLKNKEISTQIVELDEGNLHKGEASVVRLIGTK